MPLDEIMIKIYKESTKSEEVTVDLMAVMQNNTIVKDFMAHVIQVSQEDIHKEERHVF